MKKQITLIALLLAFSIGFTQTDPTPFSLSTGNFSFTEWIQNRRWGQLQITFHFGHMQPQIQN
jgi:hypothetical protein